MKSLKLKCFAKRVICFILILAISYVAVSMIGSVVIFKVLYGREELAGNFEISYDMLKTDVQRQAVTFPSGENDLNGFLYNSGGTEGVIIVAPGNLDSCDGHLAEAVFFAENGYAVLTYDGTGIKSSSGSERRGLQQAVLDLGAAIDYAEAEFRDLPVILYGHSLGGYAAASVLSEKKADAVISLSGFNSAVETMYSKAKEYIGVLADIEYPFLCLQNYFVFGDKANLTATAGINSTDTPVLICYGSNDEVINYDLSLYSHRDEITNPNAVYVSVTEEYRNNHSGMWLESASAKYLTDEKNYYRSAASSMTDEENREFYNSVDVGRATALDSDFMDMVLEFINNSVKANN